MRSRHLLLSSLVIAFMIAPLLQAQESRWENLAQIQPRTKLQVVEQSLKSTSGKFVRFSDTDLTLNVNNKEVVIPKDQIYRVSISGKNRKRNTLIGLAAGTALGLAAGFGLMERETGYAGAVAGTAVGFAGLGAGIGAMLPASRTVYRAELHKHVRVQEQSYRE